MSNTNSQIDGLGSFNQSAQNAGTIKYGAFLNASRNLGTIALSAVFGNTSINQGTIGDVLPIVTASIVQQNSGNWDSTYTTVMQNSAMWALSGGGITETIINDVVNSVINTDSFVLTTDPRLSDIPFGIDAYNTIQANSASWSLTGDTTNSPEWDAVKSNSGSLVYTNDSRLADTPNGNAALTYIRSNSADFVFDNDSRLSNARTPVSHNHDASAITSGTLDVARLPVIPSQEQVLITGVMYTSASQYFGGDDHFTDKTDSINQGTIVTTTDGYRWVYTGSGNKRYNTSYVLLADITPEWSAIANKPASFPVDGHTHDIADVTNLQSSLNNLQSNIDGKQASGNYALATDPRFTVLATNSAQWGDSTIQGYTAYTYVHQNSASLVLTNDSRLSDSRTPLTHTHDISEVTGLQSSLDGKASVASVSTKANLSAFDGLNTLVQENSGTWEGVGIVYNYFRATSAAAVYSDDIRLAKANTTYSYVTANSANIVMTSDSRLANAATTYSYVTANSANTVMTSDSRLTRANTSYTYLTANSANIVMTSDSRLTNASTTYTSIQSNSATWAIGATGSINYTIDGGGTAIATGSKGYVQVPNNFIIQEWSIIADLQTTSFIVDVRRSTYANIPTTTSIVGSDFLKLTNQQKNRNLSVSWSNVSAGDLIEFFVTGASNASMINISLKGIRS